MYISLAFEGAGAQLAVSTQASSLQVLKEPKSGVDFGGTLFSFGRGGRMGRREGRTRDGGWGWGGVGGHSGPFWDLSLTGCEAQATGHGVRA